MEENIGDGSYCLGEKFWVSKEVKGGEFYGFGNNTCM